MSKYSPQNRHKHLQVTCHARQNTSHSFPVADCQVHRLTEDFYCERKSLHYGFFSNFLTAATKCVMSYGLKLRVVNLLDSAVICVEAWG
jgi:hypothetical protein